MVDEDDRSLTVLIGGRRAGVVTMGATGRFSLTYDEAWREAETATPLSLSMPLAQRKHSDAPVRAFLWGLLPDNERVLDRWAQDYQVSPRNPFALLRHVGEDCAGAAQFVRPERVDKLMAGEGNVQWLTDTDVAERLRILRRDPTAWHVRNSGQFSLAGAQAKTALHHDPSTGRWGEPRGSAPTTHILKPAVTGLDDHDLNEHLCLTAARLLGLPAASTRVGQFGDERAIVVQRYDRRQTADGTITRIHEYRVEATTGRHWRNFAAVNGLDPDETIARIDHLVERVPDAFETVAKAETIRNLKSRMPDRLTERISAGAEKCRTRLRH